MFAVLLLAETAVRTAVTRKLTPSSMSRKKTSWKVVWRTIPRALTRSLESQPWWGVPQWFRTILVSTNVLFEWATTLEWMVVLQIQTHILSPDFRRDHRKVLSMPSAPIKAQRSSRHLLCNCTVVKLEKEED